MKLRERLAERLERACIDALARTIVWLVRYQERELAHQIAEAIRREAPRRKPDTPRTAG